MFFLGVDPVTKEPLKQREIYGTLQMNPADNLPNLAEGYYESLEAMSPRDRQRYLLGEYGQLAGLVFDNFDPEIHVYDSLTIGKDWKLYRTIDFGFTNPFTCYWAYYDEANETLYIEDEWYHSNITVNAHAVKIKEMTGDRKVEATVADHDAGDRAILEQAGIPTEKADKDVASGINNLYDGFNRNKVRINRRCVNLINELYSYQWKESGVKDTPVKDSDHGIDAIRYLYKRFMTRRMVAATPF
jgi:phage terminase large subunit